MITRSILCLLLVASSIINVFAQSVDTTRQQLTTEPIYFNDPYNACKKSKGLERKITAVGNVIDFKFIGPNEYQLQWGTTRSKLQTFSDTLYCNDPGVRNPWLVQETNKYLLMKYGCGSGCWAGIILPLSKHRKPKTIDYYVATDLNNDLIASLDLTNEGKPAITIYNLRTGRKQVTLIKEGCNSAAPHYCLIGMSLKKNRLRYNWSPKQISKGNFMRTIKVKV